MTIHEIKSNRLLLILDQELKNWKRTKWWTKDLKNSETHQRMFHFFREFIAFRRKILSGADIEKSLCEWIGIDTFWAFSKIFHICSFSTTYYSSKNSTNHKGKY